MCLFVFGTIRQDQATVEDPPLPLGIHSKHWYPTLVSIYCIPRQSHNGRSGDTLGLLLNPDIWNVEPCRHLLELKYGILYIYIFNCHVLDVHVSEDEKMIKNLITC